MGNNSSEFLIVLRGSWISLEDSGKHHKVCNFGDDMSNKSKAAVWGAVAVLGMLAFNSSAEAGWGYGWPYYGYPPIVRTQVRPLPYYAEYPPVYYDRIVPRSYGYFPHWYYPWAVLSQPATEVNSSQGYAKTSPEPLTISNQFVGDGAQAEMQYGHRAPLRIKNPFVLQPDGSAVDLANTGPKLIFPMASPDSH